MNSNSVIRETPAPLLDLHSRNVRKEHTPAAVRIFFEIVEKWDVSTEDAWLLLGGISNRYYRQLKTAPEGRILSTDRMCRISYLIGIHKALHISYGDELADRFIQMPNTNQMFGGRSPLSYMIEGGLPALQKARRLTG